MKGEEKRAGDELRERASGRRTAGESELEKGGALLQCRRLLGRLHASWWKDKQQQQQQNESPRTCVSPASDSLIGR